MHHFFMIVQQLDKLRQSKDDVSRDHDDSVSSVEGKNR